MLHQKFHVIVIGTADGIDHLLRRVPGTVVHADNAVELLAVKNGRLGPANIVRDAISQKLSLNLSFAIWVINLAEFYFIIYL